ncbi:hypothetical protein NFI96_018161, partial [Prochilodus magdalenae]
IGTTMFCAYFIVATLALISHTSGSGVDGRPGFYSKAVFQDVWPDFTVLAGGRGGFLGKSLLPPPSFSELDRSFPVPFQPWDFMNTGPSFAIKVMNSSWSALAEVNVYHRGEPVYLQVTSSVPDQELYVHSCYAAPSLNPTDKSRYALVLNKGCVSSKQPALEFISRQTNAINMTLRTSSLKFSKVYVHCSLVLSSHGLTQDTKSCNYIESKSRWVDLGGQTDVCDCCATKCRGPPYYEGLFSEFKALVSTGPLTITEQEHEKQLSVSNRTSITASRIAASAISTGKDWLPSGASPATGKGRIVSGASPSTGKGRIVSGALPTTGNGWIASGASPSAGNGWLASGASVSGNPVLNSPPLLNQPADLIISQELGGALSLWLPGLVLDVQSLPVLEKGIGYPRSKGKAKITMLSAPADLEKPEANYEAAIQKEDPLKTLPQLESGHQELASMTVADAPSEGHFRDIPKPALEGFAMESGEELRGDVFAHFREPLVEDVSELDNSNLLHSFQKSMAPEEFQGQDEVLVLTQTEEFYKKVKGDVELKPESVKQSKLTLTQVSDGSSLLSFEEEERSPVVGKEVVRKTTLELKRSKTTEEGKLGEEGSKQLDTERKLVSSLMDVLR